MKASTDMLLEMKENNGTDAVYIADFELLFVETSREFYRLESEDLVRRFDPPDYMKKVEKAILLLVGEKWPISGKQLTSPPCIDKLGGKQIGRGKIALQPLPDCEN